MTFVSILIALLAERFIIPMQERRQFGWYRRYTRWVRDLVFPLRGSNGPLGLVLVLAPVLVIVGLIQHTLGALLLGIPGLAFGVLVLMYTLGPGDLETQVEQFVEASYSGDSASSRQAAQQILGSAPPLGGTELTRRIIDAIFFQANNRIFAVLFWFTILGPLGAALYRFSSLLHDDIRGEEGPISPFAAATRRLLQILDWAPAHLTAASYALCGSFEDAWNGWNRYHDHWGYGLPETDNDILVYTGNGALQVTRDMEENGAISAQREEVNRTEAALALVWRTLISWLSVLGLVTITAWVT